MASSSLFVGIKKPNCVLVVLLLFVSSSVASSQWDCDFEHDFCNWRDSSGTAWKRSQTPVAQGKSGPIADHTYGNSSGWFANTRMNGTTVLRAKDQLDANTSYCFSFWLYMYGPNVGMFVFRAENEDLIVKEHDQGDFWHPMIVQMPKFNGPPSVYFMTSQDSQTFDDIAIDDIRVTGGSCPETKGPDCTFDNGRCSWSSAFTAQTFQFQTSAGPRIEGPEPDHTFGTKHGSFLMANATLSQPGDKVGIRSSDLPQVDPVCMRFFYFIASYDEDIHLRIESLGPTDLHSDVVWQSRSGVPRGRWIKGELTLNSPLKSQITMYFVTGKDSTGILGLDDITFTDGMCPFRGFYGFDKGLDLFYNDPNSDVDWVTGKERDGYNWLPTNDLTKHNIFGDYAIATGGSEGQKAVLWSPVFSPTNGRCTRLYLYTHGLDPGSMAIEVVSYTRQQTVSAWSLGPAQIFAESYRAIIFPIVFHDYYQLKFTVTFGVRGDWAIDDMVTFATVQGCKVKPAGAKGMTLKPLVTPSPSPKTPGMAGPLDCDFDKDFCKWTIGGADSYWTRSGLKKGERDLTPTSDHTSGHGEYIHMAISQAPNSTASLTSETVATVHVEQGCFSFWYFMRGDPSGSLKVLFKNGASSDVRFQRSRPTEQWTQVQIHVHNNTIPQIVIIGERDLPGISDISIDDIRLSNQPCDDNTEYYCSFEEEDICGFQQDEKTDEFDWSWQQTVDHTYSSNKGHVLMAKRQVAARGTANIISKAMRPMAGCLSLWWKTGSPWMLKIMMQKDGTPILITRRNSVARTDWALFEAPISSNTPFSIEIQAETLAEGIPARQSIATDDLSGNLFIDDLLISNTDCQMRGSCTFERSTCTWANDPKGDFYWTLQQGKYSDITGGPKRDSTLYSPEGHYLLLNTNPSYEQGSKAWFNSEIFPKGEQQCLEFEMNMNGKYLGYLNVYAVEVPSYKNELLWSVHKDMGPFFLFSSVFLKSRTSPYFVQIEGVSGPSVEGAIAIDDINFFPGTCSATPPESQDFRKANHTTMTTATTTLRPTSSTPSLPSSSYDCDFEKEEFCNWKNDEKALEPWIRREAGAIQTHLKDHTLGSGKGHVLTPKPYSLKRTARLVSPMLPGGAYCLTLYIKGDYSHDGNFEIVKKMRNLRIPSFVTRETSINWQKIRVNEASRDDFQILLETTRNIHSQGGIYLDDIRIFNGSCPTDNSKRIHCDFEDGGHTCDFTTNPKSNFSWTLTDVSTQIDDHSTEALSGHFIHTKSASAKPGQKAAIVSLLYHSDGSAQCMSFYFLLQGDDVGELNVYVTDSPSRAAVNLGNPQWTKNYDVGQQWNKAFVSIQNSSSYHVVFEAVAGKSTKVRNGIDDIDIVPGDCPDANNCTFENGPCLWIPQGGNVRTDFEWTHYRASIHLAESAPSFDHSTGTPDGYYMLIEANGKNSGNKARIYSQVFPASIDIQYSLSLWYHMYDNNVGSLRIYIQNNVPESDPSNEINLWETSQVITGSVNDETDWTNLNIGLSTNYTATPFQIIIEGVIGSGIKGDIAIDDILFIRKYPPHSGTTLSMPSTKPATPSAKPATSTVKPSTSSMKPSTSSAKPATSTVRPSMPSMKPSTLSTKPATSSTKPITSSMKTSTLSTKPATYRPKPLTSSMKTSTLSTKPATYSTKPLTSRMKTSTLSTKPAISSKKPSTHNVKPATPSGKTSTPNMKPPSTHDIPHTTHSSTSPTIHKSTTPPGEGSPQSAKASSSDKVGLPVGVAAGGIVVVAAIIGSIIFYRKRKSGNRRMRLESEKSINEVSTSNPLYGMYPAVHEDMSDVMKPSEVLDISPEKKQGGTAFENNLFDYSEA